MTKPRWMSALEMALSQHPKSTTYSLGTADDNGTPHVRSVVHRDFLRPSADVPLLLFTTDIRTHKVAEITRSSEQRGEICWWIPGTNEQFRFAGKVHLLPHPSHPLAGRFEGGRLAPDSDNWDWEKERVRIFNEKTSSILRASFARPTPGGMMESYDEAKNWPADLPKTYDVREGDDITKAQIHEALNNFSVVILEPLTVEWLELGVVPNQRTLFKWDGTEWKASIIV